MNEYIGLEEADESKIEYFVVENVSLVPIIIDWLWKEKVADQKEKAEDRPTYHFSLRMSIDRVKEKDIKDSFGKDGDIENGSRASAIVFLDAERKYIGRANIDEDCIAITMDSKYISVYMAGEFYFIPELKYVAPPKKKGIIKKPKLNKFWATIEYLNKNVPKIRKAGNAMMKQGLLCMVSIIVVFLVVGLIF